MLLSICIPSYNRFGELKKNVESILRSRSNDFDVVVVDNGSNEDIDSIGITDPRVKFVKQNPTVPGPVNVRTCLNYGDGDYKMLCLDKDFIVGEYLERFIEALKDDREIVCGYCILNSNNATGTSKINNVAIKDKIYRCGHPSGCFFRNDVIVWDKNHIDAYDSKSEFYNNAFLSDLLYARGLSIGSEAIFTGSLIFSEKPEKARAMKSYTYSVENKNLYFMPYWRKRQFDIFISHMSLLKISNVTYKKIVQKLFRKTLNDCTANYKAVMGDSAICEHYGIKSEKIGFVLMLKESKSFITDFKHNDLVKMNTVEKRLLVYKACLGNFARIIKSTM